MAYISNINDYFTVDDSGNITVSGNFTVSGTTTTSVTETVAISDNKLTLNTDVTGTPTENAWLEIERGTANNVLLRWNESNDTWELTTNGVNYYKILTTADEGTGNGLDADTVDGQEAVEMAWGHYYSHTSYNDFDSFLNTNKFGGHFIYSNSGSQNGPSHSGATQYYHWRTGLGSNYNNYSLQMAIPRNQTDSYLYYRNEEGGTGSSWYKINAGYADNAGQLAGYTFSNLEDRYVNVTGDTMTGALTMSAVAPQFKFTETDISTVGKYWRMPLDGGTFRFDIDTTNTVGDGTFSSYKALMVIDGVDNRVGINTSAPGEALDVAGDIRARGSGSTMAGTTIGNATLLVGSTSAGIGIDSNEILAVGDSLYLGSQTHTIFRVGSTERMRMSSTGNLGLDAQSPQGAIHIRRTGVARLILEGDTNNSGDAGERDAEILLLNDGGAGNDPFGGTTYGAHGYRISTQNYAGKTSLGFDEWHSTNGWLSRLQIDADGNVGIGTNSPVAADLHIIGETGASGLSTTVKIGSPYSNTSNHVSRLEFAETGNNTNMTYGFSITGDGNNSNSLLFRNHENSITGTVAMSINRQNGNIGIGTNLPPTDFTAYGDNFRMSFGGVNSNLSAQHRIEFWEVLPTATSTDANFAIEYDGSSTYGGDGALLFRGSASAPISTQNYVFGGISRNGKSFFMNNVGIGLTNPNHKIHLTDSSTAGEFSIKVNTGNSSGMEWGNYATFGTRYSNWDTVIGTNVRTAVGSTSSGFQLNSSYTAGGAGYLRLGFQELEYKTFSPTELNTKVEGDSLSSLGTTRMHINTTGAGFNTTPDTRLHVYNYVGNDVVSDVLKIETERSDFVNIGGSAILFQNQDGNNATNVARIKVVSTNTASQLVDSNESSSNFIFTTSSAGTEADRMTIASNGRVGIGTVIPSNLLHVHGGSLLVNKATAGNSVLADFTSGISGDGRIRMLYKEGNVGFELSDAGDGTGQDQVWTVLANDRGAGDFTINWHGSNIPGPASLDGGTEMFTVVGSTGNIGIGVTDPHEKLTVSKNGGTVTASLFRSGSNLAANTNVGILSWDADYNSSPITYGSIDVHSNSNVVRGSMDLKVKSTSGNVLTGMTLHGTSSGVNVGIGTNVPKDKLDVDGYVKAKNYYAGRNVARELGSIHSFSAAYSTGRSAANVINGTKNYEGGSDWLTPSGQRDGAWVVIDLGSSISVDRAVIYNQNEYASSHREVKDFRLQGSNDATNWTDVIDSRLGKSEAQEPNPGWSFRIPNTWTDDNEGATWRYWKFIMDSFHGSDSYGGITEIELYESSDYVRGEMSAHSMVSTDSYMETANVSRSLAVGADYGGIATGNGQIIASGNVGIGITNPSIKLHVDGGSGYAAEFKTTSDVTMQLSSSNSWTGIRFNDSGGVNDDLWHNGSNGTFAFGGGGSNVAGKKLHVHGGMTIGSGIASTATTTNGLTVEGTIRATSGVYGTNFGLEDSGFDCYINITDANPSWSGNTYGGEFYFYGDKTTSGSLLYAGGLQLYRDLVANGDIGINISSPAQRLHVYESADSPQGANKPTTVALLAARTDSTNEGPSIDFASVWTANSTYQPTNDDNGWVVARIAGVYDNAVGNGGAITFYTNAGPSATSGSDYVNLEERMRIDPTGNVGVGTTNPGNKFEVYGSAGQLFSIADSLSGTIFSVNDGSGIPSIEVDDTGQVRFAEFSGNVLVGTSTDDLTNKLQVDGGIMATGDVTAYASSDARLKTDLQQIDSALDKVNSLTGYTFNWNETAHDYHGKDTQIREAGVIAQDVEEVLPEVTTTRDDGYKAVKYEKLVPLLIEAIKDMDAKYQSRIADLENQINKLKNQ